MRQRFSLTEDQYRRLLDASRPVPYMVFGGVPPTSTQENANAAWAALGAEMGFQPMTVRPVEGTERDFTAETCEQTDRRLDEAIERRHFPCEHRPEVGSGEWQAERDRRNV